MILRWLVSPERTKLWEQINHHILVRSLTHLEPGGQYIMLLNEDITDEDFERLTQEIKNRFDFKSTGTRLVLMIGNDVSFIQVSRNLTKAKG